MFRRESDLPIDYQMSNSSHQERDLAIGRHAVMAEAFELLANHLGPFIDDRMAEYFCNEPSWAEAAANRLGRPAEHGATDPLFQLLVLRRFWGPVFADFYGQDLRQIIGQLIETRNKWAHFSFPHNPEALQRSVLAIERLLAPVEPGITGRLRRLGARVYDPDQDIDVPQHSQHPQHSASVLPAAPADSGHATQPEQADRSPGSTGLVPAVAPPRKASGSPGWSASGPGRGAGAGVGGPRPSRRRDDVDVAALRSQLAETETVFKELQYRYGDLKNELDNTKRITASKQLRLTAVEQRLVEAEDHSTAVEENLIEERITRHHIEWLIVSLLATVLLFMVLAST